MLTFLEQFEGVFGPFRQFGFLTFRMAVALMTALVICWFAYPAFISRLMRLKAEQAIRTDGPESHQAKVGTPTMGGLLILIGVVLGSVLWARPTEPSVWAVLIVAVGFGAVGFVDDYRKVAKRDSAGLSGKIRLVLEFAIAGGVLSWLMLTGGLETALPLPFSKGATLELSWGYVLFGAFVIVAFANAVNLTDGLDGLAIGPTMTSMMALAAMAYLTGNATTASYLGIPYVAGAGEMAIIAVCVVGAGLGFLWFNTFPATVFMGDTGSLPLGGVLGAIAVLTRNELVSVLVGGIFVWEAVSVVIQVVSFKLTGKRIFKMAPYHHHLELAGWKEPKIIVRFWIVSILLALTALVVALKLR